MEEYQKENPTNFDAGSTSLLWCKHKHSLKALFDYSSIPTSLARKGRVNLRLAFLAIRRRTGKVEEVGRVRREVRAYGERSLSAPQSDLVVEEKIAFRKLGRHDVVLGRRNDAHLLSHTYLATSFSIS